MFLKRLTKIPHTLAFRLTLWYAFIFTVSAGAAFLFFYLLITTVIRDRTDKDLIEQAGKFSSLLNTDGINAVKRVAVVESQAAGERKIFFRLLSVRGETFSSSNMSYWRDIEVSRSAITKLIGGKRNVMETVVIPAKGQEVRILYAVIGAGVVLQLGQSMETYTRFIHSFERIFVVTMAFLVLLAAMIGWFMARKALSGLERVTRTAQQISEGELEERVPIKKKEDEIDELALTFNRMLDRIEQLVIGVREMSDNIAHDLKSPITRMRGMAEINLTTEASMEEYRSMAGSTIEECDRLLEMINTMLFISKAEAGVWNISREKVNLFRLIQEACELFQPIAEGRGITITGPTSQLSHVSGHDSPTAPGLDVGRGVPQVAGFDPGPSPHEINGDIQLIQRMIANLIDNGIKYNRSGGNVDISLEPLQGDAVAICIKDGGLGISEKDLPHIFKRFYRGDPSRTRSGSGLGLSLAKAIAGAHGGSIRVKSIPGHGTEVFVILPLSPPT